MEINLFRYVRKQLPTFRRVLLVIAAGASFDCFSQEQHASKNQCRSFPMPQNCVPAKISSWRYAFVASETNEEGRAYAQMMDEFPKGAVFYLVSRWDTSPGKHTSHGIETFSRKIYVVCPHEGECLENEYIETGYYRIRSLQCPAGSRLLSKDTILCTYD